MAQPELRPEPQLWHQFSTDEPNSNRNYEIFWGESKEKRSFDDRHANTQTYIDYMRPRRVERSRRVLVNQITGKVC